MGEYQLKKGDAFFGTRLETIQGAGGNVVLVTSPLSQVVASSSHLLVSEGYSGDSRNDTWPNVCPRTMTAHTLPVLQQEARQEPSLSLERHWCAMEALHTASLTSQHALARWRAGDEPCDAVQAATSGPCAARLFAAVLARKRWDARGNAVLGACARRCIRLCVAWLFAEVKRIRELHGAALELAQSDGSAGRRKQARTEHIDSTGHALVVGDDLPSYSKDLMQGIEPVNGDRLMATLEQLPGTVRALEVAVKHALSPTSSMDGFPLRNLLAVQKPSDRDMVSLGIHCPALI